VRVVFVFVAAHTNNGLESTLEGVVRGSGEEGRRGNTGNKHSAFESNCKLPGKMRKAIAKREKERERTSITKVCYAKLRCQLKVKLKVLQQKKKNEI